MKPLTRCCCLSLRTATITLAAINLIYALVDVWHTVILDLVDTSHPQDAFGDEDFSDLSGEPDRIERSTSDEHSSEETYGDFAELEEQQRQFTEQYHFIIILIIVLSIASILLLFVNVISLSVLIYGAAKSKATCVRQWLVVGGLVIVNDIFGFLTYLALGVDLIYTVIPLLDTPLTIWLWVLTWSLFERCRELARRNAENPLCMAALIEDGDSSAPCTVAYSGLR